MKIALFYANWEEFGEPWSTPLGLRWELQEREHDVRVYNLYHANGALLPQKKIRTYSGDCFNRFSVDYKKGYRPDVVIVMDYGPFDYVGMDKRFFPDIPFILEAGDTPQSLQLHAQKVCKFHGVVTPDYNSAKALGTLGVRSEWMNHWADHRIFNTEEDVDIGFDVVSTCGGRRVTAEIQAKLGNRFNNERYFFGRDHARRLRMGHIVFQCSQFGEITRRIFEGMACGRMVITDRLSSDTHIEDLFVDGQDIVFYDNAQDAIDKINYYTDHPDERDAIAARGLRKVMEGHTVSHRVDQLEELIRRIQHDIK